MSGRHDSNDIIPIGHLIKKKLKMLHNSDVSQDLYQSEIHDGMKKTERRHLIHRMNSNNEGNMKPNKFSTTEMISLTQSNKHTKAPQVSIREKNQYSNRVAYEEAKKPKISPSVPLQLNMSNNDVALASSSSNDKLHQRHNSTKGPLYLENLIIIDKINGRRKTTRKQVSPYDSVPNFFKNRNKPMKPNFQSTVNIHNSNDMLKSPKHRRHPVNISMLTFCNK